MSMDPQQEIISKVQTPFLHDVLGSFCRLLPFYAGFWVCWIIVALIRLLGTPRYNIQCDQLLNNLYAIGSSAFLFLPFVRCLLSGLTILVLEMYNCIFNIKYDRNQLAWEAQKWGIVMGLMMVIMVPVSIFMITVVRALGTGSGKC